MNKSRTMSRQYSEYFLHNENENTIEMQTSPRGNPLKSDGVDGTGDANQTLVLVAHRTTGRGGQATLGSIQKTEQPAGRKRRTGGWLAMKRICGDCPGVRDGESTD